MTTDGGERVADGVAEHRADERGGGARSAVTRKRSNAPLGEVRCSARRPWYTVITRRRVITRIAGEQVAGDTRRSIRPAAPPNR